MKWNVHQPDAEKKILIQSIIMFLLLSASSFGFYFIDAIKEFVSATNQYYVFYGEYIVGDLIFGINPVLYIAFNEWVAEQTLNYSQLVERERHDV